MLFSKNRTIIIIGTDSLKLYPMGAPTPLVQAFASDYVANLDVINEDKFLEEFNKLLTTSKLRQSDIVILLKEELLFQKTFTEETGDDLFLKEQRFIDEVPFEEVISRSYKNDKEKSSTTIASNRQFYELIKKAVLSGGSTIVGIAPIKALALLGITTNTADEAISKLPFTPKLLHEINMIEGEEVSEEEKYVSPTQKVFRNPKVQVILIVLLFSLAILLVLFALGIIKSPYTDYSGTGPEPTKPPIKTRVTASPTASPAGATLSASISATPSVARAKVNIQIINGTGLPGQANTTKAALEKIGYQSIGTTTANQQTNEDTLLTFAKDLPTEYKKEIQDLMSQEFQRVVVNETDKSSLYQVTITTGREK